MTQKEIALAFLKTVGLENKVREGYDKFIHPKFVHHNQYFKNDRESLMLAMEDAGRTNPNKKLEVKFIYEDGNSVITHSLVQKENMDIVVVHIFRFEKDKIIELWDVGQLIDKNSPNEIGVF
jgi:predicted SnoaL-like aldol condensation-catalyzing enzyme